MMNNGHKKYRPFDVIDMKDRQWVTKTIEKAPTWCSVDLRDGNQALIDPMNLEEKMELFNVLVDIGVKEIEIGFPSASQTEYDIMRYLIEGDHIPDDVTIQVLVQAREHLIRRTFEAIDGAKNVIVHFYNSTSELQRRVVFKKEMDGIIDIAVEAAKLIKELGDEAEKKGMNIRYQYSPESFSQTETENAVEICQRVMDILQPTPEKKIILNLPLTVETNTPNVYADQIELFSRMLKNRENAIISLHPHNDRGTAIAAAELGMLAGAERMEGTMFGNGERTGNLDIVTLALNLYTKGIDPKLDLSNINKLREVYERTTKMQINPRHPYVGELVFTAFSGSHQDAINKGEEYLKTHSTEYWEVPYLVIDPADIGREYEPIIRINSQSGKGGAVFIMSNVFGYQLPKAMQPDFGRAIKAECDRCGTEIMPEAVMEVFQKEYIVDGPYRLIKNKFYEDDTTDEALPHVRFEGEIQKNGDAAVSISGEGNGPIDAFFNAISHVGITGYEFKNYSEHSISVGSDAKAVSYIHLITPEGKNEFGVGISHNINYASIRGILSAINRSIIKNGK